MEVSTAQHGERRLKLSRRVVVALPLQLAAHRHAIITAGQHRRLLKHFLIDDGQFEGGRVVAHGNEEGNDGRAGQAENEEEQPDKTMVVWPLIRDINADCKVQLKEMRRWISSSLIHTRYCGR